MGVDNSTILQRYVIKYNDSSSLMNVTTKNTSVTVKSGIKRSTKYMVQIQAVYLSNFLSDVTNTTTLWVTTDSNGLRKLIN